MKAANRVRQNEQRYMRSRVVLSCWSSGSQVRGVRQRYTMSRNRVVPPPLFFLQKQNRMTPIGGGRGGGAEEPLVWRAVAFVEHQRLRYAVKGGRRVS